MIEMCIMPHKPIQLLNISIIVLIVFAFSFYIRLPNDHVKTHRPVSPSTICEDIFSIQNFSTASLSSHLEEINEELLRSKSPERAYVKYALYRILGETLPTLVSRKDHFSGSGGSNFTIHKESRLDRMQWKLPYLPCQLREYTGNDIRTCIHKRSMKGKQFRITFIGDSRVRRPMEFLLELLHQYNLTLKTSERTAISLEDFFGEKGNVLWPKYKRKLTIRSSQLPNFLVKFVWAPFFSIGDSDEERLPHMTYYYEGVFSSHDQSLKKSTKHIPPILNENEFVKIYKNNSLRNATVRAMFPQLRTNGALDELKRLLFMPIEKLPDYIIIGTGSWELTTGNIDFLENLDSWAIEGAGKLYKVLDKLSSLTTVIMILPEPFKEYLRNNIDVHTYFRLQSNGNLEWYLNSQMQLFPPKIILWDSFIPVAFASIDECLTILSQHIDMASLPKVQRFEQTRYSYSCLDETHVGFEAIGIAVQMLLNQICNEDMDRIDKKSYCCDGS